MTMTTALLALAVAVLLAVLVHGWWSVRRVSPRQARPGLPGDRVEPALGAESPAAPAQASESADLPPGELPPSLPAVRPSACLDALIDALVVLTVEAPGATELRFFPFETPGAQLASGFLADAKGAALRAEIGAAA